MGKNYKAAPTDHNFSRERRTKAESNSGPSGVLLISLGSETSRLLSICVTQHANYYCAIDTLALEHLYLSAFVP